MSDSTSPAPRSRFLQRIAAMTPEQFREALRKTAEGEARDRARGLLDIVDDRDEVAKIVMARLPALFEELEK